MWKVDLKKLHRDPPIIRMPPPFVAIRNHPFFGALPAAVQTTLLKHAKEFMLLRDNLLYGEYAKANGVWFIANGNVKVSFMSSSQLERSCEQSRKTFGTLRLLSFKFSLVFDQRFKVLKADICVWLQWSSVKYNDRHVLHPIFSYGSTLGLYEALTGKPCLCSMTADSVVHGFFISNEKLLPTLFEEPGLEEFFWQVSHLISKLFH